MFAKTGGGSRWIVVGGGITGLAAAHRLIERSRQDGRRDEVILLEAGPRLGGAIETRRRDGFLLEAGPDSLLSEPPWALSLCSRLGLTPQLIETNPDQRRSFVVSRGRLVPIPDGFSILGPTRVGPFLRSPLLSWKGKLRAVLEGFVPQAVESQDESVASFVQRRFGSELYQALVEPLMRGIASGDPATLSMRALLPHFLEMEQRHGSVIRAIRKRPRQSREGDEESGGPRYGLFVSFQEGMQTLVGGLERSLPEGCVHLKSRVVQMARRSPRDRWRLDTEDGGRFEADGVCLALPPHCAAPLAARFDQGLSEELGRSLSASWVTVNIAFEADQIGQPLHGFGFISPTREGFPITGATFCHVKYPHRAPPGKALLRAFLQSGPQSRLSLVSDQEAQDAALRAFGRLLRIRGAPLFAEVHRFQSALPLYRVGHLKWVETIRDRAGRHPRLVLAGNAFGGHGIAKCVKCAEDAADELLDS